MAISLPTQYLSAYDKEEVKLPDTDINDKTYFYINCNEKRIYIQGKRYPISLNKKMTVDRLEHVIGDCINLNLRFNQSKTRYTIEEIDDIFTHSIVKSISFRHLEGLKLPEDAVLHNPKKRLDEALIESYNTYSATVLDSLDLKSKDGEQLSKNPLAKIGMILSKRNKRVKVFKTMDIIDDGEKIEIKPDGNDHKVIYVPKKDQDDSYETYDRVMKKVSKTYKGRLNQ